MPEADVADVAHLVRRHLLLDRVATLRDISDEATLEHVAQRAGTIDALKRLYLLTCADIMAVAPGLWTAVRRDQLETLYFRVLGHLADGGPARASKDDLARLRERTLEALLQSRKLAPEAVVRHCRLMPDEYMLSTPTGMMGVHISLVERLSEEPTVIDLYNADGSQYTELTVCRHDDELPGLFSRLCAALYVNEADIHNASIHTRTGDHRIVVDSLWISYNRQQLSPRRADAVCADLRAVLDGGLHPEELLRRKRRPRPHALALSKVRAHGDWSDRHTVIEVVGRDQLGFLYSVTAAFAALGLNIVVAKINTHGTVAEDAFYVTDSAGRKLTDEAALAAQEVLRERLAGSGPPSDE
jgi:[protein-PII] uridylyltransferase